LEEKRQAVIRDWFRMIIWYVRLRKASKQHTPIKLLKVELRLQKEKLKNGVRKVKQSVLDNYKPYLGSDGEKSSEVEDPMR